jgi:helicase MOV-10
MNMLFDKEQIQNKVFVSSKADPKQLGPVIRSPFAVNHHLGLSFLGRLIDTPIYTPYQEGEIRNPKVITKLLRNYRNNQHILSLPSRLFYKNELSPCADRALQEALLNWDQLPNPKVPILFHGIARRSSLSCGIQSGMLLAF